MSGTDAEDADADALAAEYVLGVLDAEARAAARRRAMTDPAFATLLRAWEARLSPLADGVPPVPPPPAIWARIAAALDEPAAAPTRAPAAPPSPGRPARAWRWAALGSGAIAASLAAILLLRPSAPPVQAVLRGAEAPVFLARLEPDGAVLVRAVGTPRVPAGRDLELWLLRPGAARPASLGVLPAGGTRVAAGQTGAGAPLAGAPLTGAQLLVSLEPPGGSPTGQPTGPVLYAGTLERL